MWKPITRHAIAGAALGVVLGFEAIELLVNLSLTPQTVAEGFDGLSVAGERRVVVVEPDQRADVQPLNDEVAERALVERVGAERLALLGQGFVHGGREPERGRRQQLDRVESSQHRAVVVEDLEALRPAAHEHGGGQHQLLSQVGLVDGRRARRRRGAGERLVVRLSSTTRHRSRSTATRPAVLSDMDSARDRAPVRASASMS